MSMSLGHNMIYTVIMKYILTIDISQECKRMLKLWRDVSKHALITKGVSKTVRQLQKLTFFLGSKGC